MTSYSSIKGDFTILKYIKDLSRDDLERKAGYETGRLDEGAVIVTLSPDQALSADDFEFGASNRWSRSSAAAPWAPQFVVNPEGTMRSDAIEYALRERGQDVAQLKVKVIKFFSYGGDNTPAKVIPRRHRLGDHYPDVMNGAIPQFKLNNPKRFILYKTILGRDFAI